jgi:glycosyltransferase involved in cell wall biosynthesis
MPRKISVCIPVKNRADLLPFTLDSLLQQTLPPYEIIVADDGSTDHLPQVIQQYKDRVIFIKNTGKGPGAGRNSGLEIATGDTIQFFDSDDLLTKNKLEAQAKALDKGGKGMVYGQYVQAYQDEQGNWIQKDVIMQHLPFPDTLPMWEWVLRGWCTITQSCLFDKDFILKEVGLWRTDLMPHEDYEFMFRIGKACPFPTHTQEGAVLYRQHGMQITDSATKIIDRSIDGLNATRLIEEQITQTPCLMTQVVFEGRRYLAIKNLIKKGADMTVFQQHLTTKNQVNSVLYRIYNKLENKKTNSTWQTMHGISADKELYQKIVNDLV